MLLFQTSFKQQQGQAGFQQQSSALEQLIYRQNLEGAYSTKSAAQARKEAAVSLYNSLVKTNEPRPGHEGNEPQLKAESKEAVRALALCSAVMAELKSATKGADQLMVGMWNAIDRITKNWQEDGKHWQGQFVQDSRHYSHYLAVAQGGLQKLPDGRPVYLFEEKAVAMFTSILDKAAQEGEGAEKKWRNFRLGEKYVEPFRQFLASMPYMRANVVQNGSTDVSFAFDYVPSGQAAAYEITEGGPQAGAVKSKAGLQVPKVSVGKEYGYSLKAKRKYSPAADLAQFHKRLDQTKTIPDAKQREEAEAQNRIASGSKTVDQSASTQLTYAAKSTRVRVDKSIKLEFDPKSPQATAQAYNLALLELRTLALDLGYSEAKEEISDFLLTRRGAQFLEEIAKKKLVVYGGATNEEPEAHAANLDLASARAMMIKDAMLKIIDNAISRQLAIKNLGKVVQSPLGTSRQGEKYVSPLSSGARSQYGEYTSRLYPSDVEIKPVVTSIWGKEGEQNLNALFLRIRNTFTSGTPEYESANEEERIYAQQLYDSFTRPQAKGQPAAIGVLPDGSFFMNNEKLAKRMMKRMPSDPTLKSKSGDALGQRYEGLVPQTDGEKKGAYFVDLLEHKYRIIDATVEGKTIKATEVTGFTRTGGSERQIDAALNLAMTALPSQVAPGTKQLDVEFSVNYSVDGKQREFITTENGGLAANYLVKGADGKWGDEKQVVLSGEPIVYRDLNGDVTKTVYRGKIDLPESGDVRIYATASKFDLKSTYAGQDVEVAKAPSKAAKTVAPNIYRPPVDIQLRQVNVGFIIPNEASTVFGAPINTLGAGRDRAQSFFNSGKTEEGFAEWSKYVESARQEFRNLDVSDPRQKAQRQKWIKELGSEENVYKFFDFLSARDFAGAAKLLKTDSLMNNLKFEDAVFNLLNDEDLKEYMREALRHDRVEFSFRPFETDAALAQVYLTVDRKTGILAIQDFPPLDINITTGNLTSMLLLKSGTLAGMFGTLGFTYGRTKVSRALETGGEHEPLTRDVTGYNASIGYQFADFLGLFAGRVEGTYERYSGHGGTPKGAFRPSFELRWKEPLNVAGVGVTPYYRGDITIDENTVRRFEDNTEGVSVAGVRNLRILGTSELGAELDLYKGLKGRVALFHTMTGLANPTYGAEVGVFFSPSEVFKLGVSHHRTSRP